MGLDPVIVGAVQRAIRDTTASDALRDQPWLIDRRVFRFCQYLRSAAGAGTPARDLLPYLELWWEACAAAMADDEDHTGEVIGLTWEDVCAQFETIWRAGTIYPMGDFWTIKAGLPAPEIPCLSRYEAAHIRRLVSAMYHAARGSADGTFFLSQADAGRIMGKSQPFGRYTLSLLMADGVIRQLERGHTGHAPKYQWTAD